MGYSQLIETGMATGDDAVRFAAKIDKEASRMLVLIKDIIRLSQLDYGENIDLNEDIDLCAIIDEIVDRLSGPAENKNIKLTYSGESEIIKGNHTQIYEMIYNLADNAIKYNRENGTVKITIENKKVSVEDTGIGIAEKDIGRIFERFYRADKSHSRATGGTGLGLSIVKHVAEINKAKVDVESVVNVGTKFTVTFQ
jgi:two-component system phosphate regulon sensor histidine kinase PhoR